MDRRYTEQNGTHLTFMCSTCFKQAQNLLSVAAIIKSFLPRITHTTSDPASTPIVVDPEVQHVSQPLATQPFQLY